jgi:elongation factor Ts
MKISIEAVKELRNRTNVGIADCNKALLEVGGDMEKAVEFLKQRGAAIAEKKKDAAVTEGVIEAYIHHTKRIGALVELNCETDFVARTAEFKELAHDLAMQIAATSPQFLTSEEIPPKTEAETDPQAACLLSQPSIKEPTKTVQEIIAETIAKVGENIKVRRFARFELGVDH